MSCLICGEKSAYELDWNYGDLCAELCEACLPEPLQAELKRQRERVETLREANRIAAEKRELEVQLSWPKRRAKYEAEHKK